MLLLGARNATLGSQVVESSWASVFNDDKKLIAKVLNSYLFAARLLKESGVKIKNLRNFFLGSSKRNP